MPTINELDTISPAYSHWGGADGDKKNMSFNNDGSRLVIGEYHYELPYNQGATNQGRVVIYERSGTTWSLYGNHIVLDSPSADDEFGRKVQISGTGDRIITTTKSGNVTVYKEPTTSTGDWVKIGEWNVGPAARLSIGNTIAISDDGNTVAVARGSTHDVKFYRYVSDNNWLDIGTTPHTADHTANWLGTGSNAMFNKDGTVFVVPGHKTQDRVYVFRYISDNNWVEDTFSGNNFSGNAGYNGYNGASTLSINNAGTRILSGAWGTHQGKYNSGLIGIFDYNSNTNQWELNQTFVELGSDYDHYGAAAVMNGNGDKLLVSKNNYNNMGHSYLYSFSNNTITRIGNIYIPQMWDGTKWGGFLAMSEDGSHYAISVSKTIGGERGRVYTYNIVPEEPVINSYTTSSATYETYTPITTNSPSLTNSADSFVITPALPNGLSFNTTTGEITGIPTSGISSSNFDITATNSAGTSTVFTIAIVVNVAITGKLTSDLAGIQGLETAKITEANDIIAAVSTDATDAVAESTSKQALDKFSTATSFGAFNKGHKRSVFKSVMKAMVANLSSGKFKMNDKAEFLKFVKPADDSIDLGAKLKDTIEVIKPTATTVTVDMNNASVYVPFEDGESQTFVDSATGREFTMGKTGSDFTLTVADSSGGVHTIPPNYTGVADQEGDVYTYVDSTNSRETIFVWGSGTASTNISMGQVQGDPYITTLAGETYKMDDFTGFVRLLQGEYEGKPFTINAENKLLTKTEIKELLEWRQIKMRGMNFSENVRFGKFPAYFSKFYVSHGDKYAIVDANSLQVLETNYEPKLAHSIQLNQGYVWSEALKTVSRADLTVGELQMSMMSYEDKDIRNGFKLFNMEKLQNRSGALEHPIYVKDMKIRSIRSVVPIKQQSARKNKKVSKEEIIENGLKTQHTFKVF